MPPRLSTLHPPPTPKRPFSVTILVIVVLIFTSLNALRFITALRQRSLLASLPLDVPVIYLMLTGLFWTLLGIPLVVGLFFGRKWSWSLAHWTVILYSLYYWLDRLVVAQSMTIATRWPFAAGLTAVLIAFSLWVLTQPKARSFYDVHGYFLIQKE